MYRVLRTSSKTLISADEVIAASPTNSNVDSRFINSAIEIAEWRFIRPVLCKDLYNDLRDKKNQVVNEFNKDFLQSLLPTNAQILEVGQIVNAIEFVSNSWYVDLWNEILWKTIAESVTYIASPTNFSRFTAQGEMNNNPKSPIEGRDSESVELGVMKWKMDRMLQDRISPSMSILEQWLSDNRSAFPLSNCHDWCYDDSINGTSSLNRDGIAIQRKTGWIFGVYPSLNRGGCGCGCNDDN